MVKACQRSGIQQHEMKVSAGLPTIRNFAVQSESAIVSAGLYSGADRIIRACSNARRVAPESLMKWQQRPTPSWQIEEAASIFRLPYRYAQVPLLSCVRQETWWRLLRSLSFSCASRRILSTFLIYRYFGPLDSRAKFLSDTLQRITPIYARLKISSRKARIRRIRAFLVLPARASTENFFGVFYRK